MEEGLIGAVIGGLLALAGQLMSEGIRGRSTRKNLVVALAAEAHAVAEIVRRRQWLEQLADYEDEARTHGHVYQFSAHLPAELITCTRAAAMNAGLLPGRLPGLVARLVMLADGAASDIRRLAEYPIDDPKSLLQRDHPAGAANVYAELIGVLVHALWTCDMVVLEAKEHYPSQTELLVEQKPTLIEQAVRNKMEAASATRQP